jgi:1-acyl-sn-glycerol-3-phosphate acyltransferase
LNLMTGYGQIWIGLHSLIIYCWIFIGTFIFGLLAILASFFSRNGNSVHHIARLWGRSILWVSGIRTVTSGFSHTMGRHSYIYMSNHQSNFDIPVLYSALPVQFRWLAKAELFKIPIFGQGMRGAGYISIDRSNRQSAFRSLAEAADAIRNGTSVMIFPEGTRSTDGTLLPYKKGGFVMAVDAGVPIVPVVISGTHAIMPKGRLLIRRQWVHVHVGVPIESADFSRKTKDDLMAKVRTAMLEMMPETARGGSHG